MQLDVNSEAKKEICPKFYSALYFEIKNDSMAWLMIKHKQAYSEAKMKVGRCSNGLAHANVKLENCQFAHSTMREKVTTFDLP